jgi:hypothetical protein
MLQYITDPHHQLLQYVKDDPVRPEISVEFRVSHGRRVYVIVNEDKPQAMVCVSFHDNVPVKVEDLSEVAQQPTTAVFYTIWSYVPGAGRTLLESTVKNIKESFPSVNRFVTLSPKTEMARRFHLKNGALVLQENDSTVNYEYHAIR